MGREKCFEKGSKKPTLSAKEERIAKKPEGRISLKASRPKLISILPSVATSKQRVFSSKRVSSRSTSVKDLFSFSIKRSSLLVKITRKRGPLLGEEPKLEDSSTFSRLITSSLKEKVSFNDSLTKMASLR